MKRKELTKILVMISNWKKNFGIHGLYKKISALDYCDIILTKLILLMRQTSLDVQINMTFTHLNLFYIVRDMPSQKAVSAYL